MGFTTPYLQSKKYNTVPILRNYEMGNQLHPSSGEAFSSKKFRYNSPKNQDVKFLTGGFFWCVLFFLKCPVYKNTHETVSS